MKGAKDSRASYVLGGFFVPLYDAWMGGWSVGGRGERKGRKREKEQSRSIKYKSQLKR